MEAQDQTAASTEHPDEDATQRTDREVCLVHQVTASPDVVYNMWTDPHHLPNWFGPEGFTVTMQDIDVREGGQWRFGMHGPHGRDSANVIDYIALVKPERLVYVHREGSETPAWQFQVTASFTREDGGTEVRLLIVYDNAEMRDQMVAAGIIEAGNSTLQRLERYVASIQTQPAATS